MHTYTRDSDNIKFYHFISRFFFPVLFVMQFFKTANLFFLHLDRPGEIILAVLLLYFSAFTAFTLKRFKPLAIGSMIITDLLLVIEPLIQALKLIGNDDEYSALGEYGLTAVVRLAFTVYSIIYMHKRKELFVKDYEAKLAMEEEEAEAPADDFCSAPVTTLEPASKEKKHIADLILCPFLVLLVFSIIVDWSRVLLSEVCAFAPFMGRLLAYPFLGDVPPEYPYTTARIGLEVLLGFFAIKPLYRAGVFAREDLSMGKKDKKLLPFIIASVGGILLVLLISLFQIKVFGSSYRVNKLFPRIIFTICCGGFYYMFVGIFEELLMRGVLMKYYLKKGKTVLAVIVSDLTFVIMHFVTGTYNEWRAFVFLFFLGLLLCMVYLCTDNLWVAMGVHFGYDWAITHLFEMRFVANKNSFFSLTKLFKWNTTTSISVMCFVFTVVLFILYMQKKKRARVQ